MALKSAPFNGVKPKCTQGRWIDTHFETSTGTLSIKEHFLERKTQVTLVRAKLPSLVNDRIIGRITCIACSGSVFVLQYITQKSKFIRFLLINAACADTLVVPFEDTEHYFHKDFTAVCPVECLINAGLTRAIFRLPQPIMSSRKWSKMLTANLELSSDEKFNLLKLTCEGLRDRRNQAVAFHPRHPDEVVHILLNEYGSTCKINVYNLKTRTIKLQAEYRLDIKEMPNDGTSESNDSDSNEESDTPSLVQCNMDFCKSGEFIVLCCNLKLNLSRREQQLKLHIISAHSLQLVRTENQTLQGSRGIISNMTRQLITPVFSPCDSKVDLWFLEIGKPHKPLDFQMRLPKIPNLQGLCRETILKACHIEEVEKLPLPPKLHQYLKFNVSIKTVPSDMRV